MFYSKNNNAKNAFGIRVLPDLYVHGYEFLKNDLRDLLGNSNVYFPEFCTIVEEQLCGKIPVLVRRDGNEELMEDFALFKCRLGDILILDTGYSYEDKEIKLFLRLERSKTGLYRFETRCEWRILDQEEYTPLTPRTITNGHGIARILAHICNSTDKKVERCLNFAFFSADDETIEAKEICVKIRHQTVWLTFSIDNDAATCFTIDEESIRNNEACPGIYRMLRLRLDLLYEDAILRSLHELLFKNPRIPCGWAHWIETKDGLVKDVPSDYASLTYYLEGILERLCTEKRADKACNAVIEDADQLGFWFCTGLVNYAQHIIYGHIHDLKDECFTKIDWHAWPDSRLPKNLPISPDWTRDAALLTFDRAALGKVNLDNAIGHTKKDHPERLPDWPDNKVDEEIKEAFQRSYKAAQGNYRIILPGFYHGQLSLLMPLCFGDKPIEDPDAYLVINRTGTGGYKAPTILTPSMAYYSSRIVTPQATLDWEHSFFARFLKTKSFLPFKHKPAPGQSTPPPALPKEQEPSTVGPAPSSFASPRPKSADGFMSGLEDLLRFSTQTRDCD